MADVFISYQHDERWAVEEIAKRLRALELTVWFDASLSAGDSFSDEIDRETRAAKVVLVCWSPAARKSRWVRAEAMIGFEQDKLAACYIAGPDGFLPPTPFNTCHAQDLRAWLAEPSDQSEDWKAVLRQIGRLCRRSDIESWAKLRRDADLGDLRSWITRYGVSPALAFVDSQIREREAEEEARERAGRELIERRQGEIAAHREQEERSRAAQQVWTRQYHGKSNPTTKVALWLLGAAVLVPLIGILSWALPDGGIRTATVQSSDGYELPADRSEFVIFEDMQRGKKVEELDLKENETLQQLLSRGGASVADSQAASIAIHNLPQLEALRVGLRVRVALDNVGSETKLLAVSFYSEPGTAVHITRIQNGDFVARQVREPVTFEVASIEGRIGSDLSASASTRGATGREIVAFLNALSFTPDTVAMLSPTDTFEMMFERFHDGDGTTVRTGDLLFVAITTDQSAQSLYSFQPPDESHPLWFDGEGRSTGDDGRILTSRDLELFRIEKNRIDSLRIARRSRGARARTQ